MSSAYGEVAKMFERFVNQRAAQTFILQGKVTTVDKENATFDVEPLDGSAPYQDVQILPVADTSKLSIVMYPKKDSLVTIMKLNETESFLLNCQEIDQLEMAVADDFKLLINENGECILNDGTNGGLIIINKLQQEINKNSQILQTILSVLAVPVNEAGNGSPSVFQQALNLALQGLSTADLSNITNDKIQH